MEKIAKTETRTTVKCIKCYNCAEEFYVNAEFNRHFNEKHLGLAKAKTVYPKNIPKDDKFIWSLFK
jgi:uncharacterized C2H2 Zn-finger protein